MILPIWARKPNHKKEVIATKRGWEVKETGELLSSHRDLDQKLKALAEEIKSVDTDLIAESKPNQESKVEASTSEEEKVEDQPKSDQETEVNKTEEKPKPKRRGRPKKNDSTNKTD